MAALKILYGAGFAVVLPVLLVVWARAAEPNVSLSAPALPWLGWLLAVCGAGAMAEAMRELWIFGGGLPMNAFPPRRLVSRGIFRLVAHPIYSGFTAICLGTSMLARSAAGCWLVTPSVALGCAALVLGYERLDMIRRFGDTLHLLPRTFMPRLGFWEALRRAAECVANSWREWRFGSVRVIHHGFYAGAAAFVQTAIAVAAVGTEALPAVALIALAGLIGAGVWAQWVEGSSRLRRPFGFYGGFLAVFAACLLFDARWRLLGGFVLGAPWMQTIGRLRCLVNGCCHGAPARAGIGIRVTHPRSRVTRLAELAGVPIHATQLYSMLANVVLGVLLVPLWSVGCPLSLICGVYAIGNGCARFAEEGYRGEPQTPVIGGLRLYQWIAFGSVALGAVLTTLHGPAAPALGITSAGFALSAAAGLAAAFAMGVDFPESNRRFARLT